MADTDWLDGVVPRQAATTTGPGLAEEPQPQEEPPPADDPAPEVEPVERQMLTGLLAHFVGMSADARADRRARGNGRNWWMRWMGEQAASVEAHLYFYLHERHRRRDGRRGWDLDTNSPLINEVFALGYRAYGLTLGLVFGCLLPYASAWIHQRPGRALLALALRGIFWWNIVSLLVAHVCKG